MKINTEQLKCFVHVAENRNFARAAQALFITQPAVTNQIQSLEKELGVKLLIRTTRHVELTPAGMTFYNDAKELLTKTRHAVARVLSQETNPLNLSIGLSNHVALYHLSGILKEFHANAPNVNPHISVLSYKAILNLFLDKKLDLLFYYKDNLTNTAGVSYTELKNDALSCVVPRDHPFTSMIPLTADDLKTETIIACNPLNTPRFIAQMQNQLLKDHAPDRVHYCDSIEVAHCMVRAGLGISIIPNLLCIQSEPLRVLPFAYPAGISFGVFHHSEEHNSCIKQFVKIAEKQFRTL